MLYFSNTHHNTALILFFILRSIANHTGINHLGAVGHNLQKQFSCLTPFP